MTDQLGSLEQLVLLALLQLGDGAYGVAVQQEIATRTARDISFGAIYTTLGRLEQKGYVGTRLGDPTPERGGRRKKHYTLRAPGKRALQGSLNDLRTMTRGLGAALDLR
ncbi:MAG TPA: helix-turn-helix transcriptional regulator [Gemmatimonadaceae bacterium]|nr:helix-turn-helix transcriptional regulator [Gemmatimonadaceae bacterium]